MGKKIIIIDHEPFTVRRKAIFYVDELSKRGLEIEFWDCSSFFHPGMLLPDTIEDKRVRKFQCLSAIEQALIHTDIAQTLFIVEAFNCWNNRRFFALLARYNCYTIRQEMYATAVLTEMSFVEKLFHTPVSVLFKAVIHRLEALLYKEYKKLHKIHYNLKISSGNAPDIDVHINHPDWELFQDIKDKPSLFSRPYAVFIDEYFPLHPDLLFFYKQKPGDAGHYRKVLNLFLKKTEEKYGLEIIIAAHPKSNYDTDSFAGRKIIKGQTVQLVKDAQFVFMHSSAALSFIMMFDKPLMLISTNDYEHAHVLYRNMLQISELIELPIYNIEKSLQGEPEKIKEGIRKKYIYSYLTSTGIEDKKNEIILSQLFSHL